MDETAFLQFYIRGGDIVPGRIEDRYRWSNWAVLSNGFSFIWDEAKPIWIRIDSQKFGPDLPIKAKNIYVSVWYSLHLTIVAKWAAENPDCRFIIGGPILQVWDSIRVTLPQNLIALRGDAEQIFNRNPNPRTWKLVLPPEESKVMYSYYLGSDCYWKRCKFCNCGFGDEREFSIEPLKEAPPGFVWFSTPSLPIGSFDVLARLPYDGSKTYWVMIRGTQVEVDELKKILPQIPDPKCLMFSMGVEFPSDRMLKFMNKGTTTKQLLEAINLIISHGHDLGLFYIVDWPNLTQGDIEEAKRFFNSFDGNAVYHRYGSLVVYEGSNLPTEWKQKKYGNRGFFYGYGPVLNNEQQKLNGEFLSLLDKYPYVGERTHLKEMKEEQ